MTSSDPGSPPPPPPPPADHSELPPHTKGNPFITAMVWIIVLGGLAAGGFFGWWYYQSSQGSANAKNQRPDRPQPVVVQEARAGDLPIYIESVGTVAAYNNVTIRTRIDGQLDKVAFTEGQLVQAGEIGR